MFRLNYVTDSEFLFTPKQGRGKAERRIMQDHFPNNDTHFYSSLRKLDFSGFLQVIFTDKSDANNIYTESNLQAVLSVDSDIRGFNDNEYGVVCAKFYGSCEAIPIINLLRAQPSLARPIIQYPVITGYPGGLFIGSQLGGVQTGENGLISSAVAIQVTYSVQYLGSDAREATSDWFKLLTERLQAIDVENVSVAFQTTDSLDNELDDATLSIISLFSATYSAMCIFSVVSCMMLDWVSFSVNLCSDKQQ